MPESQDALLLQRRARRRLVGAIALVLFVVIALPMVFDQEPRPVPQDLVIDIPNPESGKFHPKIDAPTVPDAKPAGAVPAAIVPSETAKQGDTSVEAPRGMAEAAKEPPKAAERAPDEAAASASEQSGTDKSAAEKPKAKSGDYVVSLGVFSDPANAKQAQSKAQAAGFKLYSERLKSPHGVQTRVRAGPFATREAAEQARDKLKSLGLSPGGVVAREPQAREPS